MNYAKLINNKLTTYKNPLTVDGFNIFNPSPEQLKENGWKEYITEDVDRVKSLTSDAMSEFEETDDYIKLTWKYEVSESKMKNYYTKLTQELMDAKVQERNYDNIHSACTYSTSSNPKFKKEGEACVAWRDAVWETCYELLDKVLMGEIEPPSEEEFLKMLPEFNWGEQ